VMGYGAIDQALADQKALKAEQQRLTAVQHAVQVLVQDFTQLTPRPVRDEIGNGSLPCLMGSPTGISLTGPEAASPGSVTLGPSASTAASGNGVDGVDPGASTSGAGPDDTGTSSGTDSGANSGLDLVVLTRMGWANPAGIQRPTEERVAYRLEKGVFERLHWPELDVTEGTLPVTQDLLDHVKSVTFRYLTEAHQWTDQWPPQGTAALAPLAGNQMLRLRPIAVEVTLDLTDWGTIVRIIEIPT
ncbi:MAG: type II secretion system minor pseudopilin GspJ, partial [Steroidobacteraceae bacterium]